MLSRKLGDEAGYVCVCGCVGGWVCGCVGVVYGGLHVVNTLLWGFRFPCSANRAILSRLYNLFYLRPSLFSLCRLYLSHTLSPTHTVFPFQIRESLYRKMVCTATDLSIP
jgi:hypothetical protein